MDRIMDCCAGLDVHKKTIAACVRWVDEKGKIQKQVRSFGTMTPDLLLLFDWLTENKVIQVAMESTGVYWKPVWNILEGAFDVLLVNAHHMKQVPGRKTDIKDCEWIAELLQHGLLKRSFVPGRQIRELRDLTRHRKVLSQQKSAVANRVHKVLEDANIKLSSVATDILGASGRAMLKAIISGNDNPDELSELSRNRLRNKITQLRSALSGRTTDHHRFMLRLLFDELSHCETMIEELSARIEELMRPFDEDLAIIMEIPGIARRAAENILAEIGFDMNQYPSAAHLASWAGMCPGNNESAGKRKSGKTTKGDKWLRCALTEAAWAAGRSKGTFLSERFKRLAARRGQKRALIATGHTLLVIIYFLLKHRSRFVDLGADYFVRLDPERKKNHHLRQLEQLGYRVSLESAEIKSTA